MFLKTIKLFEISPAAVTCFIKMKEIWYGCQKHITNVVGFHCPHVVFIFQN